MSYSTPEVLYRLGLVVALVEIWSLAGGQPGGGMVAPVLIMLGAIAWGGGGFAAIYGLAQGLYLSRIDPRPKAEDYRGEWYLLTDLGEVAKDEDGEPIVFDETEVADEVGLDSTMSILDDRLAALDERDPARAPHYARDAHSVQVESWARRHGRLGYTSVLPDIRDPHHDD